MNKESLFHRYKKFVFGTDDSFDVQKRIFLLITHTTLIIAFAGIFTNIILGLAVSLTIVTIAAFLLVLYLHTYVRRNQLDTRFSIIFFLISVFTFSCLWFLNGGYNGNTTVLIFVYFIVVVTILPVRYRIVSFIVYLVMIVGLVTIQFLYPDFITHYETEEQRYIDLALGYFMYLILAYTIQHTILRNYEAEREKVKTKNNQLNELINRLNETNQKLEESLQKVGELNSSKDRFVTILSHDLRSPFHGLMGLSQTLKDEFDNFSEIDKKHLVTQINQSIGKVYTFLEELLLWGRIQKNALYPTYSSANIRELIEQAVLVFIETAEKKKIRFDIKCSEKLVAVLDKELISMVIRNLISNAIKFSEENKTVAIEAIQTGGVLSFSIIDQGIGIPAEILSQLFKIDEVTTRAGTDGEKGSGMGLILCMGIIKKLNGELDIQSIEGEGTIVILKIPFNSPLV